MGVPGYIVFAVGFSLQCILLWRCIRQRLSRFYPFFFAYFLYAFLRTVVLFPLYFLHHPAYAWWYWMSDLVGTLLWFAVAWEVFRQAFPRHSTLRSLAGRLLVFTLLALAIIFYLSGAKAGQSLIEDFERKLALATATWLLLVLAVARYYAVPIARNIWGMATGLLLLASTHLATFAAVELFPAFFPVWRLVNPCGYDLVLLIWTWTLWYYIPNRNVVVIDEPLLNQALSDWEQHWESLGTALRKAMKL